MELSRSETLMYATHKIEMLNTEEICTGYATGFLMGIPHNNSDHLFHMILVTNRHVLAACQKIRISFISKKSYQQSLHSPEIIPTTINTDAAIMHPNPNIDLAVLDISRCLKRLCESDTPPFYSYLLPELIPTPEDWESFDAMEPIVMIGYPNGILDSKNNLPIFRQGITATHPAFDFEGLPVFLADMSCFPGSSGSPVLIHNQGMPYFDKRTHSIKFTDRTFLMGIQHATQIMSDLINTTDQPATIRQYIDLGRIIKSSELLAFFPLIESAR